jgi:hypothetical protein
MPALPTKSNSFKRASHRVSGTVLVVKMGASPASTPAVSFPDTG